MNTVVLIPFIICLWLSHCAKENRWPLVLYIFILSNFLKAMNWNHIVLNYLEHGNLFDKLAKLGTLCKNTLTKNTLWKIHPHQFSVWIGPFLFLITGWMQHHLRMSLFPIICGLCRSWQSFENCIPHICHFLPPALFPDQEFDTKKIATQLISRIIYRLKQRYRSD